MHLIHSSRVLCYDARKIQKEVAQNVITIGTSIVLVHLGDCSMPAVVHFDQNIPPNGFILPSFWFYWSGHGKAIILTKLRRTGPYVYKRSGFVGANIRLWTAFKEYKESGVEEETFYLV
ncbi:uncharacterized protein A1O5_05935 [Cladophialophora psammophila CBS 110553]|uniref:Uncharacterized protein n=1 Tax=Cladophialophora psammophila CBS 110553 TaxID=1182543 RepID=W9WSN9_9EURO|nr:uncharacterized protein A1O5_05935 [Cladophialophora psammophila CBS 110553]EXJ70943.1 hypothetical protein A1O5_05935 [Cladophialophora psammophila CBS 110553]